MTQHITLTAEQANTFNTTGHLEGFKELCEWQPPNDIHLNDGSITVHHVCGETWAVMRRNDFGRLDTKELTPTRAVGQVYACKEPCNITDPGIVSSNPEHNKRDDNGCDRMVSYCRSSEYQDYYNVRCLVASQMPDWAVRLHAKIATEPTLQIHEGKLVWTYDLVKE